MELFYTERRNISATHLRLVGDEAHHATVLRHKRGDRIMVTDGEGLEYKVLVEAVVPGNVTCRVIAQVRKPREPLVGVTLACGVLKGPRLAFLVEKATELGVWEIIPMLTARALSALPGDEKLRRLRRIAVSGMKTAQRSILPRVTAPMGFEEVLKSGRNFSVRLLAWEGEKKTRLADVLPERVKNALVLIGPEGGFEPAEIEAAAKLGFDFFSLGPRRLRAETAAVAALALVMYQLGEM